MKKFLGIAILLTSISFAQDMRQNSFSSLFSDQKANRPGDAITVLVVESSQASNNASTSSGRRSEIGADLSVNTGAGAGTDVNGGIGTNNDFSGSGSTKTTGMIRTKISASVDSVLANGNLLIKGSKLLVINGEEQTIKIKGVVRTSDIQGDNSVLSYNIADAEITFEGAGLIDDSQKPGWITKFLHWIF